MITYSLRFPLSEKCPFPFHLWNAVSLCIRFWTDTPVTGKSHVTLSLGKYGRVSVNRREGTKGKPKLTWWTSGLCLGYRNVGERSFIGAEMTQRQLIPQEPRQAWVTGHQSRAPGTHCTTCRQFSRGENFLPGSSAALCVFQAVCVASVSSRCLSCLCLF